MSIHESLITRRAELATSKETTARLRREVEELEARSWAEPQTPSWYLDHPVELRHIMESTFAGYKPLAVVDSILEHVSPGSRCFVRREYGALSIGTAGQSINTDGIETLVDAIIAGGGKVHKVRVAAHRDVVFFGPGRWCVSRREAAGYQTLADALADAAVAW